MGLQGPVPGSTAGAEIRHCVTRITPFARRLRQHPVNVNAPGDPAQS
jgi:hypothetical protein